MIRPMGTTTTNVLQKTRNIGIIAHIDAGKTTVTERILYFSGKIYKKGEVHDGNTVTDYMPEERERGITIKSAATACEWDSYKINILDTPGHVDFTAEVERSLRVLDGAVGVFCAVAGVQAQSETVWRQANRYHVPRISFINKIDRIGGDMNKAVKSIREKLGGNAVPLQIPIGREKDFIGVVDVIAGEAIYFNDADEDAFTKGPVPPELVAEMEKAREVIIDAASQFDDAIMEKFMAGETITAAEMKRGLRAATMACKATPVLVGTALKNKGVHQLLDAVCEYLPSPLDMPPIKGKIPGKAEEEVERLPDPAGALAALAFKTISDRNGDLTFIRVYSGELLNGSVVWNARKGKQERINRLYKMHADKREPVEKLSAGDMGAAVGLKLTFTGDTLCDRDNPIILGAMSFPDPVISMSIAPKTTADREKLGEALSQMVKEDPTFHRHTDEETGEVVISGMGELHLDIKVTVLQREQNVSVDVGRPKVAYRQTFDREVEVEGKHVKQTGGHGQYGVVKVRFELHPLLTGGVEFESEVVGGRVPTEYVPAVEDGLKEFGKRGGRLKWPFVGIKAILYDGKAHDVDSSELAFKSASELAFREAIDRVRIVLLEPMMRIEVEVPEANVGDVIGDLNSRRAQVDEVSYSGVNRIVSGKVPLAELFQYSTTLRSMTQGRGTYSSEPCAYTPVPAAIAEKIILDRAKALELR
ncbi:MAG: elongation factor [Planctomycetota bacterium]|nr:MAG: elongation factor [Planctomycetota bacterium]